jgi:hypothetical protein
MTQGDRRRIRVCHGTAPPAKDVDQHGPSASLGHRQAQHSPGESLRLAVGEEQELHDYTSDNCMHPQPTATPATVRFSAAVS